MKFIKNIGFVLCLSTLYCGPFGGSEVQGRPVGTAPKLVAPSQTVIEKGKREKLVWSDEFSQAGAPDSTKWGYDLGNGHDGWGNAEWEYYTNRRVNSIVEGGLLKIKAIREAYNGSRFTSARLVSRGKYEFNYGRVEARAKLPHGTGVWPAIWMLGANINTVPWPACGEIDIMEQKGVEPDRIYGTFHYPGHSGNQADGKTLMIQKATTDFHLYSLEWSPAELKIFVDQKLIHQLKNSPETPFNTPFYLIMNLAIGGYFTGAVDPQLNEAQFEIDYIRVYQQN